MNFDESQLRYIESGRFFTRLLAPAGTGKTSSILGKCLFFQANSEIINPKYLIITFTRSARDELRSRLACSDTYSSIRDSCIVETLNSWGYQYLKRNVSGSLSIQESDFDKYKLFNNILRPIWSKNKRLSKLFEKKRNSHKYVLNVFENLKTLGFRHDTDELIHSFKFHLDWIIESGLDNFFEAEIVNPLKNNGILGNSHSDVVEGLSTFIKFWKKCTERLFESNIITFEDQKYWCLLKLEEKYKEKFVPEPNRYHIVIVDEFQDINPVDLFLIRKIQQINKSFLSIVGDDDQAIFEWRGASPKFIVEPDKFFIIPFDTFTLSNNYRSPKNIVIKSEILINNNTYRVLKKIQPTIQYDAEIEVHRFEKHSDSLSMILDLSKKCTKPKELAIIARKKSQIIPSQITLISNNINFYAKEDINIILSKAYEDIKDLLLLIATKNENRYPNDVINNFIKCCEYVKPFPLKKNERESLKNTLYKTRPKNANEAIISISSSDKIQNNLKDKIIMSIGKTLEVDSVSEAINRIGIHMEGLQKNYVKSDDDIFYKDPPFMYLAEYAEKYGRNYIDFINQIEETISRMYSLNNLSDDEIDQEIDLPVHLMTALRSKGKEFDTVIVLDANDGIWPIKYADTKEKLEQERRLFYVTVTRPKKRLIFMVVDKILNTPTAISPYLAEMDIS